MASATYTMRALNAAGVPDYSDVLSASSTTSQSEDVGASKPNASMWACHHCGHAGDCLQVCGRCKKAVYCSPLCLTGLNHHLTCQ
jgi:hypothetical protein